MRQVTWAIVSLAWLLGGHPAAAEQRRPGALADLRIAHGHGVIAEAWFADPTTRYKHFVLGFRYEAGSLVVRLANGSLRKLTLPESSGFEDRQPRLADLDGDGVDEIVVVHSYLDRGAALAIVALRDDKLEIVAETPPTGSPRTWLNPRHRGFRRGWSSRYCLCADAGMLSVCSGFGRCAPESSYRLPRCRGSRTMRQGRRVSACPRLRILTVTGSPTWRCHRSIGDRYVCSRSKVALASFRATHCRRRLWTTSRLRRKRVGHQSLLDLPMAGA